MMPWSVICVRACVYARAPARVCQSMGETESEI